jgi:two-component system cell cycle sensor histidine kinase/response regulator CckA
MNNRPTYGELEKRVKELEIKVARFEKDEESLRESLDSYRRLVALTPDVFAINRMKDGRYLQINDAFCHLTGYSTDEVIGRTAEDLRLYAGPEERERLLNALRRRGPIDGIEIRYRAKDGTILDCLVSARRIRFQGERCLLAVTTNITPLAKAQRALRESEEKYRNILETIEEGYYENDLAGNFTFCNETVLKFFGLSREEFIGTNFRDYLSAETAERLEASFRKIFRTGIPAEVIDYEVNAKDGSKRTIELSASLLKNVSGEPIGFRGITRDVTQKRKAELALRESEARFRTIFETAQDAIFLKDEDLKYTLVNPSMARLFGIDANDVIGRTDEVLFGPFEGARTRPTELRVLRGEIIEEEENRTIGETQRTFHTIKVPISGNNGTFIGICGFSRDLTETKKLEAQLLQSQKMEAIGILAGGISHDFNNLLQAVLGYSQILMSNKPENDPEFDQLREIERAARRAGELTTQLLAFSRKVESKLRPVDLNYEVRQVERLLKRTIPKMIDIDMRLEDHITTINADPAQLEQVMLNIGVNARDAMPEGGRLVIETTNITLDESFCMRHPGSTPGDHVLLSITDTGVGMGEETLEHVFEPFYTTKEASKGTGLGLAMVYGIVKNHHGYILCESELGVGTTFKIYLPAIKTEAVESEEGAIAPVPRGKGETVLLIDDEEILTKIAEEALTRHDYQVITASSGEEGLRLYKENMKAVALIVLDLIMPGMGGKQCLDEILRLNPQAKVVIASGYSVEGSMEEDLLAKTFGYIRKPFDIRNMLTLIREVLDSKP